MTDQTPDGGRLPEADDEPSVIGAGCGLHHMPTKADAEAAWRVLYVARMVECGIHVEDAHACCDAGDVNLADDPEHAADDELSYWASDGEVEP